MRTLAWLVPALLAAGCLQATEAPDPGREGPEGAAPDWSFLDTEGQRVSRDEPPGNATVLFFMATWCPSCKATAPTLAEAHAAHAAEGVRFLSVSVDPSETDADLEAWKAQRAQPWPHGVDRARALAPTFGIVSQSSVVVLDADGRVVQKWGYGQVTDEGLRDAVGRALAAA